MLNFLPKETIIRLNLAELFINGLEPTSKETILARGIGLGLTAGVGALELTAQPGLHDKPVKKH
jgi:hypothetical protein